MRFRIGLLAAAAILTALSLAGIACERGEGYGKEANKTAAVKPKITEDEAKVAATKAMPGTVRSVRLETEDGRSVYEVTIAPESSGNSQTAAAATNVLVDANTGNIIKTEAAGADKDKDNDKDDDD
jgi:uncharacterized membrane protein YkoI